MKTCINTPPRASSQTGRRGGSVHLRLSRSCDRREFWVSNTSYGVSNAPSTVVDLSGRVPDNHITSQELPPMYHLTSTGLRFFSSAASFRKSRTEFESPTADPSSCCGSVRPSLVPTRLSRSIPIHPSGPHRPSSSTNSRGTAKSQLSSCSCTGSTRVR